MFRKSPSYIGVDIGTTGLKVAELKRIKNKPRLINYGYSDEISDFANKDLQIDIEKSASILKEVLKKSNIKSINGIVAMPSFAVFSSVLNLTNADEKDLESTVMWEAKKVVPLDLEEMILDWKVIKDSDNQVKKKVDNQEKEPAEVKDEENSGDKKNTKILLTGAPKNLVNKYIEIFKKAKINLLSLETEMFSLVRSLVGEDPAIVAVVDLGAVNTDIAIIENGLPMFSRSIDSGGIMITKAISESLKVDFRRAEQFKLDFSLNSQQSTNQNELPKIIQETISPIVNEIKYSLNLFQQENNKKIEKVILSGGGANLVNVIDYLSNLLNIKVIAGDPWARVSYPLDLKPVLDEIGPKMSIAVGLALREVD